MADPTYNMDVVVEMKWTHDNLKMLIDTARGKNPCPKAEKFIKKLDDEYEGKPRKKSKKQKRDFLDRIFDWMEED